MERFAYYFDYAFVYKLNNVNSPGILKITKTKEWATGDAGVRFGKHLPTFANKRQEKY